MIGSKLCGRRGVTLLETLLAVGILAIVITVISAGMPVALHVYKEAVASSEASVLASTLTEAIADELRWPTDLQEGGKYVSAVYGKNAQIMVDKSGQLTVGSYPLVGERAYTNNLRVSKFSCDYEKGIFSVEFTIQESDGKERKKVEFQIVPANDSNTAAAPPAP